MKFQKNSTRKFISLLLAASMFASVVPVKAVEDVVQPQTTEATSTPVENASTVQEAVDNYLPVVDDDDTQLTLPEFEGYTFEIYG